MEDLRYTAIGYYNEKNNKITLELGIPAEIVPKSELSFYNLSVKLSINHFLNVLMINLKRPNTEIQEINNYEYKLEIDLKNDTIISEYNEPVLDLSQPEILVLLVHDDDISSDSIREIKDNVFKYYGIAKFKSFYISNAYQKKGSPILGRPRTIGMSIIKK
ncbi:hypothetical protein H9X57_02160 [Flavobacterium piscinae]|uniref:Uncharacterized protein n=1 Tax=Flavobacterium piscinae TaxID=2506424 RepID=A0A4Q1KPG0_9FLAO|nr:hypothetical protein [Flavobacterium piscinae]MBC8882634.1 hypothetical protein [Flavobacterium piscinae]RXR31350.1 hypothetical protein EQG68_10740 [Flavobacterium piscinae]